MTAPVAVVTGAGSGIGRAVAVVLAERGYRLLLGGRTEPALAGTFDEVTSTSGAKHGHRKLDVAAPDSIETFYAHPMLGDGLATLVNCAGSPLRGPAAEVAAHDWHRVFEVNALGIFQSCQAALRLFRPGSSVVNVGSVAALVGISNRSAYAASKAAVDGLTRSLAVEWGSYGVRVNAVLPGWTKTPMVESSAREGFLDVQQLSGRIPVGRLAEPREIATAVAFLASPDASYITGQCLVVDGGFVVSGDR